MDTSDWLSALALIISSGAFFLEVKRWFDSGPKIKLSVMSDAVILGEKPKVDRLAVTVTNQGDTPTTVTHMLIHQYDNWWKRYRRRASMTAIVPSPEWPGSPPIPIRINVNEYWIGMTKYDDQLQDIRAKGQLYVGVKCTHSDSYTLARVRPKISLPVVSIKPPSAG